MSGRVSSTITLSGIDTIPIYNIHGQKLLTNGVANVNYYLNGKIFATSKSKTIDTYNSFYGTYISVKKTEPTNTVYANGFTRTSVITRIYNRNSEGTLTGMKVSGTSNGTEIINKKVVKYIGKIYISTRYDPKEIINEKYNTCDYKKVKTSSSPVLLKIISLES